MVSRELPSEIILAILTLIPSRTSLDTCKLVCKEWRDIICDSSFLSAYWERSKNMCGYFIQTNTYNKFVSYDESNDHYKDCMKRLVPLDMKILASCNQGILCCLNQKYSRYYVGKPTTQQWKILPNPINHAQTEGVVAITIFQSTPYLCFKIVRLSLHPTLWSTNAKTYRHEIFDSKNWFWYETENITMGRKEEFSPNPAISAHNYIFWLTNHDNVLAVHRSNDSHEMFKLPALVHQNSNSFRYKQLLEYERNLAFTCLTEEGETEMWILNDMINKIWIKKRIINLENLKKKVKLLSVPQDGRSFHFRSDFESENLVCYEPHRHSFKDVVGGVCFCFLVFAMSMCYV